MKACPNRGKARPLQRTSEQDKSLINKTSNLCLFTQKGHPIYPAGTAGFSFSRNGGLYRATGKRWLIRTGSGDEPLC